MSKDNFKDIARKAIHKVIASIKRPYDIPQTQKQIDHSINETKIAKLAQVISRSSTYHLFVSYLTNINIAEEIHNLL